MDFRRTRQRAHTFPQPASSIVSRDAITYSILHFVFTSYTFFYQTSKAYSNVAKFPFLQMLSLVGGGFSVWFGLVWFR